MSDNIVKDNSTEISDNVIIALVEKVMRESRNIILSKKKKSVRVTALEGTRKIDIFVDVDYGIEIPPNVKNLQRKVKHAVEKVTGLVIREVNVVVEGLNLDNIIDK